MNGASRTGQPAGFMGRRPRNKKRQLGPDNLRTMSNLTDPRVLFAAERTLLAWNRTSISFMAFGFVVERFGLFINIMGKEEAKFLQREISFYLGMVFVILAILISFISIYQYKNIMLSLTKDEIPKGYNIWLTAKVNGVVGILGIILIYYLYQGF